MRLPFLFLADETLSLTLIRRLISKKSNKCTEFIALHTVYQCINRSEAGSQLINGVGFVFFLPSNIPMKTDWLVVDNNVIVELASMGAWNIL